ncbi:MULTISPECIES: acyl carrier protein [unclassified Streptomyces]|uniref:acyl carrier protein n=1 Tax=unclassified Streptomyces TaxID=2593676 RepID=UPI002DD82A05|nr:MULTISPECIES: acyl carrier protein [unclassified Streptomyces]WSA95916.1 acyl carrier protein [Streptomyces sp. NBC_01795]WSB80331.1 acyl carrier protein [Streptomyces sp. NBC_01775]WSS11458.1 acyl carrier protein [Streptomyces sp. NBC_01186]WSS40172.1 acyl carrier protein [Streptomyces sp. NBC_01187]
MADTATESAVAGKLIAFMRERFIPEEFRESFDEDTKLLELGVLDSLNAARLLNFIRSELGVGLPSSAIDSDTFQDVRHLAAAVCAVPPAPAATKESRT